MVMNYLHQFEFNDSEIIKLIEAQKSESYFTYAAAFVFPVRKIAY